MSKLLLKLKQFLLKLFFAVVFARLLDFFAQWMGFIARLVEFPILLSQFIMNRSHMVVKAIIVAIFSVVFVVVVVYDMKIILLFIAVTILMSTGKSISVGPFIARIFSVAYMFLASVIIVICASFDVPYVPYYVNFIVIVVVIITLTVILISGFVEASMYRTIASKCRMQATGYRLKYGTKATKDPAVKYRTQLMEYCIQYIMYQISEHTYSIQSKGELAQLMGKGYLLDPQGNQLEKCKELNECVKKCITVKNNYLTLLDYFPPIVALREEIKRIKGWNRLQSKAEEGEIKSICPNPSETITLLKLVLDYLESLCPRAVLSEVLNAMDLKITIITKS
jgi:hypothetical protein